MAAGAEGLVVGVGGDHEHVLHAVPVEFGHIVQSGPVAPLRLGRSGAVVGELDGSCVHHGHRVSSGPVLSSSSPTISPTAATSRAAWC